MSTLPQNSNLKKGLVNAVCQGLASHQHPTPATTTTKTKTNQPTKQKRSVLFCPVVQDCLPSVQTWSSSSLWHCWKAVEASDFRDDWKSSRGQCLEGHIRTNLFPWSLLASSGQITMGQENTDYIQHHALKYTLTTYKLSPLTFYYSNRKKSQMSRNSVRHATLDRKVENLSLSSCSQETHAIPDVLRTQPLHEHSYCQVGSLSSSINSILSKYQVTLPSQIGRDVMLRRGF